MAPLLSNYLRQQRFQAVAAYLKGDILDLGCGHAGITRLLLPGQAYTGVEGHPEIYQWLVRQFPQYRFFHLNLDHDIMEFEGQFDTILMLAIVEHLVDPGRILRKIPALLKPQGELLVTTPTPAGGPLHAIGARLGLVYREAVEEHQVLYNREMLGTLLDASGLRLVHYRKFLFGWNQLFISQGAD